MTVATEKAVLAGGCFWGMQDLIRKRPGVISTRVGYTGGDVANATYRHHGSHAEAVEITFDPAEVSYRELLEFFFQIHDPTTKDRQGNDMGPSYRSAIFYTTEAQKKTAEDTIADVNASGLWPGRVVTDISPAGPFWEAEPEHQDYLEAVPQRLHVPFPSPEVEAAAPGRDRRPVRARAVWPRRVRRLRNPVPGGRNGWRWPPRPRRRLPVSWNRSGRRRRRRPRADWSRRAAGAGGGRPMWGPGRRR